MADDRNNVPALSQFNPAPASQRDWDADLWRWQALHQQAAHLVAQERELRKELFQHYFPDAKAGTNKCTLPDGWELKATVPPKREVDNAKFNALKSVTLGQLGFEYASKLGVQAFPPDTLAHVALLLNMDAMVKAEPELIGKQYSALTEAQKQFFDYCVTTKQGSITLELVPPKEPKQAA